jgi:putative redox protein
MSNPKRHALLHWSAEDPVFRGTAGEKGTATLVLDGSSADGPSPMEALLLSLAGCMAVDIQMILEKGRVPLDTLEVEVEGERAPTPPKRYIRIVMDVRTRGPAEEDRGKVERAVELSRDKYCSVFHTLDPELETEIRIHLD